ncbi:unnamed protein product [Nesidiocoris tenuis]|uniref:Uncharacterized protein n=1 Tax=Nesidiocoris tenuis TaxID=355587 RepID=A0A6H5G1H6_9HEMI|nr:unnamed protein product [Nesidiocoris tenuis]
MNSNNNYKPTCNSKFLRIITSEISHANGNVQARRRRQSISEDPASYIWTDLSPLQLLQWLGSVRRRSTDFRLAKYSNCIRTSSSPNRGWIHGLRWPS